MFIYLFYFLSLFEELYLYGLFQNDSLAQVQIVRCQNFCQVMPSVGATCERMAKITFESWGLHTVQYSITIYCQPESGKRE